MLTLNNKFPEFNLPNQDGQMRTLKNYEGKWLVLYVYPKDDTPGCTIQGQSFTKEKAQFDQLNVAVVGVSQDDVNSHKDFCNKFSFTIELLADTEAMLLTAAGVLQTEHKGTMYWNRTTFLISPAGVLTKIYENVKAVGHEAMLINDITEIKSSLN